MHAGDSNLIAIGALSVFVQWTSAWCQRERSLWHLIGDLIVVQFLYLETKNVSDWAILLSVWLREVCYFHKPSGWLPIVSVVNDKLSFYRFKCHKIYSDPSIVSLQRIITCYICNWNDLFGYYGNSKYAQCIWLDWSSIADLYQQTIASHEMLLDFRPGARFLDNINRLTFQPSNHEYYHVDIDSTFRSVDQIKTCNSLARSFIVLFSIHVFYPISKISSIDAHTNGLIEVRRILCDC